MNRPIDARRRLPISLLAIPALAMSCAVTAAWDVENTDAPYTEAHLELSEGTWMTVDVSPDGSTLAFDLLGDIYVMPTAGGDATLVHGGPAMQRDPEFSPDGRQLLFVSDADGGNNAWISNVDGSAARPVTNETVNSITGPGWGHDGSYIVAARLYSSADKLRASELQLFELTGGVGTQAVPPPENGESVHEPQVSADGRYLYYTEKVSGPTPSHVYIDANHINYAVKRRDLETGDTREVAKGWGSATTPRLSPDGERLAFVRRVMDKTVLFVVDLATGKEMPVFDGLDRDAQADFIWQGSYYPQYDWIDDDDIAIWGKGKLWRVSTRTADISELPFHARATHRLTEAPRFEKQLAPDSFTVRAIRQLAYAPNGRRVVFNALGRLWLKSLPAGMPQRLSDADANEFEPAFSPDGKTLAYVDWRDEHGSRLMLHDLASGEGTVLLESIGVLRTPSFSSDGRQIAYVVDEGDRCLGGHAAETGTYRIDVQTGETRRIAEAVSSPQFSPDGERIWFTTSAYESGRTITRIESADLAGSERRVHAAAEGADIRDVRISPNLSWISFLELQQYYVVPYLDTGETVAISANGSTGAVRRLTDIGGYNLSWSADSSRVYWSLGDTLHSSVIAAAGVVDAEPVAVGLRVPADVPEGVVALVNARIVTLASDTADDRTIEDGTIIVRDNRIAAIGASTEIDVPADAKVLDIAGKTVLPGFVDMHGHISHCYYTSSGLMPQKQPSRYSELAYGVTTNYDPYTSELSAYSQSEMTLAGDMVGPRAIESGHVIYGRSEKSDGVYVPIDNYSDAVAVMERKRAIGGTIIKSYRQPMRSQRQQLIEAGRDAGIMVDVEGESDFFLNLTSIIDGQTNLQHNMPVATYYDDVVQLMAHGDMTHTPTLIVLFGELMGENYIYQTMRVWEDPKAQTFIQVTTSGYSPLGTPHYAPPYVRGMTTIHAAHEVYEIGFRSVARSMKRLDDAGVIVTAGSHGQAAGLALHWEMWLLAEGGMDNRRVLRTATINGAFSLGLAAQIGSLEVGKLADLVVLDENPLDDIRDTNSIRYTMINGRLYDAYSMNEIGNYDRPRSLFYWETGRTPNVTEWKSAWSHQ